MKRSFKSMRFSIVLSMYMITALFMPLSVFAEPPTATISSPLDGLTVSKGQSIRFEGSGIDLEDGMLKGSSLVWVSSREGPIGEGEAFETYLSGGSHLITLTVTDSDSEKATTQISVTVLE